MCYDLKMLKYRKATLQDVKSLSKFTDWWLAGRGFNKGVPGAVNDCFISPGQHRKYVKKYSVHLCIDDTKIVAWAVVQHGGVMIHLLVAGNYRGTGIGSRLLNILSPRYVRSKLDQSSGNPIDFYLKAGYRKVALVKSKSRLDIEKLRPFRKYNIDILVYPGKIKPDPRRVDIELKQGGRFSD